MRPTFSNIYFLLTKFTFEGNTGNTRSSYDERGTKRVNNLAHFFLFTSVGIPQQLHKLKANCNIYLHKSYSNRIVIEKNTQSIYSFVGLDLTCLYN